MSTKTYTQASEVITVIKETHAPDRVVVFTLYSDAEETFVTMPKTFKSDEDAQAEVVRLASRVIDAQAKKAEIIAKRS
jgi:hypothetical protein